MEECKENSWLDGIIVVIDLSKDLETVKKELEFSLDSIAGIHAPLCFYFSHCEKSNWPKISKNFKVDAKTPTSLSKTAPSPIPLDHQLYEKLNEIVHESLEKADKKTSVFNVIAGAGMQAKKLSNVESVLQWIQDGMTKKLNQKSTNLSKGLRKLTGANVALATHFDRLGRSVLPEKKKWLEEIDLAQLSQEYETELTGAKELSREALDCLKGDSFNPTISRSWTSALQPCWTAQSKFRRKAEKAIATAMEKGIKGSLDACGVEAIVAAKKEILVETKQHLDDAIRDTSENTVRDLVDRAEAEKTSLKSASSMKSLQSLLKAGVDNIKARLPKILAIMSVIIAIKWILILIPLISVSTSVWQGIDLFGFLLVLAVVLTGQRDRDQTNHVTVWQFLFGNDEEQVLHSLRKNMHSSLQTEPDDCPLSTNTVDLKEKIGKIHGKCLNQLWDQLIRLSSDTNRKQSLEKIQDKMDPLKSNISKLIKEIKNEG